MLLAGASGAEPELEKAGQALITVLVCGNFWTRESHLGQYLQRGLEPEPQTGPGDTGCWGDFTIK